MRSSTGARMRQLVSWLATAGFLFASVSTAWAQEPEQPVALLHDALSASMKLGDTGGFAARYEVVAPAVRRTFDLESLGRRIIGRHWKTVSDTDRLALVERLSELAIVTLAARFDDFDGERFVIEEVLVLPGGDAHRVRSLIEFSDGGSVRLDYAVHYRGDGWRIFNVWFDGVSGTRIKRNEFDGLLRRDGAAALIERLDAQIAQLSGR